MAVLVPLALGLTGCDTDDGRALRSPAPGATAPPLATSTTAAENLGTPPVGSGSSSLALSSATFAEGAAMPARLSSCDGEDLSPALAWTGVPLETTELALTVIDPDAPGAPFVHWVVGGIDPSVTGFEEGGLPESAIEVRPWTGPCPPDGETHDYVVTLYALSEPAGMTADTGVEAALGALESTPGPTATLRGTYARPAS